MRFCLSIIITVVVISSTSAQKPDKEAAAAFDKLINHCSDSASVLASERKRLGDKFETELLRYLGTDVEKHYWLACAISDCSADAGRELESLALLIQLQALSLLEGRKDDDSLYMMVSLHVVSAVQSELLGFHELAIAHKSKVEALVTRQPLLKGGFPALTKEHWGLYYSLPRRTATALPKARTQRSPPR